MQSSHDVEIAALRRRRAELEIQLRFRALVLEGLLRRKIDSIQTWEHHLLSLTSEPLSKESLGFGRVSKGRPIEDLKTLAKRIQHAQSTGSQDDPTQLLREVISSLDTQVRDRVKYSKAAPSSAIATLLEDLQSATVNALREFNDETHRVFICSDVHLGIHGSGEDALADLMGICDPGDTLILLGDILDFWIADVDDRSMVNIIVANWRDLYKALSKLRDRNVSVVYLPGNHDSFVFALEAATHVEWCGSVLRRSKTLQRIQRKIADCRLVSVADIRYPFFKLKDAMLTHGHAHQLEWRFLGGIPKLSGTPGVGADQRERSRLAEVSGSTIAFLTTLPMVLSHRFARELRSIFNLGDTAIDWVNGVQDVAIEITNQHLQAYQKAELLTLRDKTEFADSLEKVFRELCASPGSSNVVDIYHRRALEAVREYHGHESDLSEVRRSSEKYLNTPSRALNFHLRVEQDSDVTFDAGAPKQPWWIH